MDAFTKEIHSLVHKIKLQEQNKKEYETMNIHDQDTFYRGKKEGIQEGIQQGLQQGIQQGMQQGLQQGAQEKAIETARKLLAMGLTFKQVAEGTDLPLETVEELAKHITTPQQSC